jgi:hypothetical protein
MDLLKEIASLRAVMALPYASNDSAVMVDRATLKALCNAAESYLQPDLFAVPHQKASETSAEAARKWTPKAKTNGMIALRCVDYCNSYGVTREELCEITGMLNQTAAGRLNVLKTARLIRAEGKRPSATTGFNQEVYYLAPRGEAFLKSQEHKL